MANVNEMKARVNELQAQIWACEKKIGSENARILYQEILNLLNGVGDGYVEGDYYAPSRYYSSIEGVKNIRIREAFPNWIFVKVISPRGYLLPKKIKVGGTQFRIEFLQSKNFSERVDY